MNKEIVAPLNFFETELAPLSLLDQRGDANGQVPAMLRIAVTCFKPKKPYDQDQIMKSYRIAPTIPALALAAVCISLSGCQDQKTPPVSPPPKTPAIEWSPERKLTWDDYKRKPKDGTGLDAESAVYFTASGVGCKDGKVVYQVRAVFEPDESWVDPTKKSDALLKHEQGHFDLAELAARKLRKALDALASLCEDKKAFNEAVKKALKQAQEDFDKAQQKYDTDTDHGDDADKQKKADEDIKKGLDDLKDYKK